MNTSGISACNERSVCLTEPVLPCELVDPRVAGRRDYHTAVAWLPQGLKNTERYSCPGLCLRFSVLLSASMEARPGSSHPRPVTSGRAAASVSHIKYPREGGRRERGREGWTHEGRKSGKEGRRATEGQKERGWAWVSV
ncbi:hypothetical protein E2C01_094018 [Portunus trituberculatus]|uniref:Uncharacterized protein n=1 Tax=Portunus trituberculatus TaxID=210409 RepID=A0A5B7JPB6_PORTR|nr:hypothetical protein [Portunus trituberculatus]